MDNIGYMCKIAHDYELGVASGGVAIYSSIKDLKFHHSCVDSCGIVKVEIKTLEVIEETDENV